MRDHMERVCSSNWDISATLNGKDQDMKMTITPNDVEASNPEFFSPEPPVERKADGDPLKVKILINYAPQESTAAAMAPVDASALDFHSCGRDRPRAAHHEVQYCGVQPERRSAGGLSGQRSG